MFRFLLNPIYLLMLLFFGAMSIAAETPVVVVANNLNIRAENKPGSKIVCQASKGDALIAISAVDQEWVQIIPPVKADLWVYGELIQEGKVAVKSVQVRCGPGISYRPVGSIVLGQDVTIRGTSGDWAKIAPLKGTSLWVSGKYIKLPSEIEKDVAVVKPAKKLPVPVKPVKVQPKKTVPAWKPAAPAKPVVKRQPAPYRKPPMPVDDPAFLPPSESGRRTASSSLPSVIDEENTKVPIPSIMKKRNLVASSKQGERVQYSGVMSSVGFIWGKPADYRLMKTDNKGRSVTICYLLDNGLDIAHMQGRRVVVYGREYWVQGVRYSIVLPEKVIKSVKSY